jgi:heptosyltransferase III
MQSDDFSRILVICTRQLGDVLLTTPLVRAAKRRWPAASIDVLGFGGTLGMLRGNIDVSELIEVPAGSGWRGSWPLIRRLWRRYDLALVAQHSDRAHLYAWVAARRRSGLVPLRADGSVWWKRGLLLHAVEIAGDRGAAHSVTEKLRLLQPWLEHGTAAAQPRLQAPAPEPLPTAIATQLRGGPVVVHVPSMWRYKQWPLTHFRYLIESLLADGHQVVLTGGAGKTDREMVVQVLDLGAPPALLNACGQLTLGQMVTLLQQAALYVGPDTSITHLAAAVGVSIVALFGPTNPQRWGPWPLGSATEQPYRQREQRQAVGSIVLLQGPDLPTGPCVPCGRAGCEDHNASRSHCLDHIAPERVVEEARVLLAASANSIDLAPQRAREA